MRVSFNDLAERELHDAAAYYELEHAGLGGAFIAAVEQCVDAIAAHPMAGAATTRGHDERPNIGLQPSATGVKMSRRG